MLLVASVREALRLDEESESPSGIAAKLKQRRSTLPAVTHVDYSARVQTVSAVTNPRFYELLSAFERRTGCPVLVNTSFNVRGEPPVCTPQDAFRCFMRTDMDYLVLGNFLIDKKSRNGGLSRDCGTDLNQPAVSRLAHFRTSPSTLQRFGLTIGFAFLLFGGLLQFKHRGASRPFALFAAVLLLCSAFAPRWLRFIYRPWMRLAGLLRAVI